MPSHGHPIVDPTTGRVIGIACSRGRRFDKCASCKTDDGKLACDGCDKPLCPACSVAPTGKLDFCPTCAKPAFELWKKDHGGQEVYAKEGRAVGRVKFRAWVKANKKVFNDMVKRTDASRAEVK